MKCNFRPRDCAVNTLARACDRARASRIRRERGASFGGPGRGSPNPTSPPTPDLGGSGRGQKIDTNSDPEKCNFLCPVLSKFDTIFVPKFSTRNWTRKSPQTGVTFRPKFEPSRRLSPDRLRTGGSAPCPGRPVSGVPPEPPESLRNRFRGENCPPGIGLNFMHGSSDLASAFSVDF